MVATYGGSKEAASTDRRSDSYHMRPPVREKIDETTMASFFPSGDHSRKCTDEVNDSCLWKSLERLLLLAVCRLRRKNSISLAGTATNLSSGDQRACRASGEAVVPP